MPWIDHWDFVVYFTIPIRYHFVVFLLVLIYNNRYDYSFFSGLLAREIAKKYPTQDISILFDERTTKVASMNSLSDYIRIKLYTMVGFYGNITVDQANSKSSLGLQAADVISNTIYQSIESGKQHFLKIIESRIESRQHFPQGKFGK
nr:MAG TPA: Protein of unknown function (DUF3800) [Caudoviricetes sp.]